MNVDIIFDFRLNKPTCRNTCRHSYFLCFKKVANEEVIK